MNLTKIINSSIFTIGVITCIAYAANTITSITQTASNGDTVTASWVNEVNGKLLSATPTGFIGAFNLTTCPTGWIPADGTNGTPDLRGEFIRGLDNGRGVDTGRSLASSQSGTITYSYGNNLGGVPFSAFENMDSTSNVGVWTSGNISSGVNTGRGAVKGIVRPRNVAFLYCIKQ